ncbi:MAG: PAS domain S-box protein [Dehalococcoidia bacterium]|nr:PAS domain S-box protein [Dehalococcoidia bacterium]
MDDAQDESLISEIADIPWSPERWQEIFDAIPEMVSIHDRNHRIIKANKALARTFDVTPEQLEGKNCYQIFHSGDLPIENCPHLTTILEKKQAVTEIFEPARNAYLEISTSPIFDSCGEITGTVHIIRDISERKRLDRAKDEFVSFVSHELRTPLTVITGCLSTILAEWERLPPEETQQLLDDAVLESESMSYLLENLLELSRARGNRLILYKEPVNLKTLLNEVLVKIKQQFKEHKFTAAFADGLRLINADPNRIQRILYNLIENAATLSNTQSRIRISAKASQGYLIIGVSNQEYLPPDQQQTILDPLQPEIANNCPKFRATDLGMLVCKQLVEAHGGDIWIESAVHKGTTFFISFPFGQALNL